MARSLNRFHKRIWLVLLALVTVFAPTVHAQSPADRSALEAFRDSLALVGNLDALADLETRLIDVAKRNRDDPMIHLRLGLVALRMGRIAGVSHARRGTPFDDAAVEFEWAAELAPDWPYPWYGIGLAEVGLSYLPNTAAENVREHLGKDHLSRAADAFARATEADPGFLPAVTALAEVALKQKVRPKRDLALAAVRRAAGAAARGQPAVHLARARLERELGRSDSALVALQAYLADGGDQAIGLFESAQALYDLHQERDGQDAYYDGAGNIATTKARALYRTDIEWVADSAELRSYDLAAVAELRGWMRRFWERRDVAAGRRPGERLAEHRRRQTHALREYRRVGSAEFVPALYDPPAVSLNVADAALIDLALRRGPNPISAGACGSELVDARGVIYVRHGEPDKIAFYAGADARPNVSWRYDRPAPEPPLIFHFMPPNGMNDYCLYPLPDLHPGVLDSRAALGGDYAILGSQMAVSRAVSRGWRDLATGLTTDTHALRFARTLAPMARSYALRTPAGDGSRLVVAYAIPGHQLEPSGDREPPVYRVRIRTLIATDRDSLIDFADTTRDYRASQRLVEGQFLTGVSEFQLPEGRYGLRVVVSQGRGEQAGGAVVRQGIEVPDFGDPRLSLSDLVLGRVGQPSGLSIWNGRDSIPVGPLNAYPAGSNLSVYYEVVGIVGGAGATYETEIQVVPVLEGDTEAEIEARTPAVALRFTEAAEQPFTRVTRGVDLGSLPAGPYRLRVRVEDPATGVARRREAGFTVIP